MARSRDDVRAARAAVLLRCQTAREEGRRLAVARADAEWDLARTGERSARAALADGQARADREIVTIGGALRAGALAPQTLDALMTREAAVLTSVGSLERDVAAAAVLVFAAEAHRTAAAAALVAERGITRKRRRLADATAATWRRELDFADEREREDQVADMWRPA